MKCFYCNSETHLAKNCKKNKQKGVYLAEENEEHVANFLGVVSSESSYEDSLMAWQTEEELGEFTQEAYGKAILDTGCTSTVTGQKWLEHYRKMLPEECKTLLKGPYYTNSVFRCANNIPMKSEGRFRVPVRIGKSWTSVWTEVVKVDIPMLLSLDQMKRFKTNINMTDNTAEVLGANVVLGVSKKGHYLLDLLEGI